MIMKINSLENFTLGKQALSEAASRWLEGLDLHRVGRVYKGRSDETEKRLALKEAVKLLSREATGGK